MRRMTLRVGAGMVLALLCVALPACDRGQEEEMTRLQGQVEDLQAERETLTAERDSLRKELGDVQEQRDELTRHRDALKTDAERAAELEDKLAREEENARGLAKEVSDLKEQIAQREQKPEPEPDAPAELPVAKVRDRLLQLGADLFGRGNYNAAHAVLLSARQLGAEAPLVLYRLAYCEAYFREFEAAAEHYQACRGLLEATPGADAELLKKCLNNHGVVLSQLKQPEDAVATYNRVIALDDSYAPAYFNLGLLYARQLSNDEEAIEAFRKHVAHGGQQSVSALNWIRKLQQPPEERPEEPPE